MDQNTAQLIEKFRRNPAMAQSLLQSGDGQKLMQMLTRQDGGAALNRAAQSAASTPRPLRAKKNALAGVRAFKGSHCRGG